jgi:hypothetical protein
MKFIGYLFASLTILESLSFIAYRKIKKSKKYRDGVEAINYIMSNDIGSPNRKFIAKPYSLYWNAPLREDSGILQTDLGGYRLTKHRNLFDGKEKIVLVLGGSTTFSDHYSNDPENTWVSHAQEYLFERGIKNVRLINAGLNYATTAELLSHYIFLGQHLNPIIVVMDGPGNDFLPVAYGDSTTDYSKTRIAFYFQKRKYEKLILKSFAIKLLFTKIATSANLVHMEPQNFLLGKFEEQNLRLINSEAAVYELNMTTLINQCIFNNSPLIAIDFLRPSEDAMKNYYPLIYKGLISFNNKCSEINRRLASQYRSVSHVEFSDIADKYFMDSCHLSSEGEKIKGRTVALKIYDLVLEMNI